MPFNGSGTYAAPASSWNPAVSATTINSTDWTALLADLTTALSTTICKDGQSTPTANIPMGGFKFTGLGAGTGTGNSVRFEQVFTTTALTDAAPTTWDTSLAPVATWTMTANRTLSAPTNVKAGGTYTLIITQDGTGGRVVTWNAAYKAFGGGTMPQPETTLSTSSAFTFVSPDGTNLICTSCIPFVDTNYIVRGSADATKKVRFEVDGLTTATTRVVTLPDANITLPSFDYSSQTANTVLAGPTSGGAGAATFRSLTAADIPGLALLNSGAASGATLDIVMTSYTAFAHKLLVFDLIPANDAVSLVLRVSTDGGGTYNGTANDYSDEMQLVDDSAGTAAQNRAAGAGATFIYLSYATNIGNGATEGISGNLFMPNTTSTAKWPRFSVRAEAISADATPRFVQYSGGGTRRAAQDTDAIRIFFDSGNISSGTWRLYGYN